MSRSTSTLRPILGAVLTGTTIVIVMHLGSGAPRRPHGERTADTPLAQAHHLGIPSAYSTLREANAVEVEPTDQAIKDTLAGLDSSVIVDASVTDPPPDSGYDGGQWLNATVSADPKGSPESLIFPTWEAELAQGAIADRIAGTEENLAGVIVDSNIIARGPDGTEESVGGGSGDILSHQVFGAQQGDDSDAEIASSVGTALKPFGLENVDIRVLHPLGPAIVIKVQVSNLEALDHRFGELIDAVDPSQSSYEGFYFEIDGLDGRILAVDAQALRTGVGHVWFADGIDTELGVTMD